MLISLYLK